MENNYCSHPTNIQIFKNKSDKQKSFYFLFSIRNYRNFKIRLEFDVINEKPIRQIYMQIDNFTNQLRK